MQKDSPYLNNQIITYLGNKRKLIGFIDETVQEIIQSDESLKTKSPEQIKFFDIFAGSGIVGRYAKAKGFQVYSNDLEIYSTIINKSILTTSPTQAEIAFLSTFIKIRKAGFDAPLNPDGYYQSVLDFLNSRKAPMREENRYFSIHYAPKETANPSFDGERVFYTQENALKIDAIVELIFNEQLFSETDRNVILTSVMYHMTKNINTSGVMKGFHNGWGGSSKSSLSRIMEDIHIVRLPLIDGAQCTALNGYAESAFTDFDLPQMDIIYADPPYNQHQYSSNYNHLTTICKNDRYQPGAVVKGSRAGIRADHNRSDFCKKSKNSERIIVAEEAFTKFITSIKSKYLIVSYNNEGIIAIDRLIEILANHGKNTVTIKSKEHDKFKGGRTKNADTKVDEYLIIVKLKA